MKKQKLVMLPGMDGTGLLFKPLIDLLPEWIDPIIIRYPATEMLALDELVDYVKTQLPSEPFSLLAESFSGPIGYRLCIDSELPITRIIFVASFVTCPNQNLIYWLKYLPLNLILKIRRPKRLVNYFCFGGKADDSLLNLFEKALTQVNTNVLSHRICQLDKIVAPTQKIHQPCLNLIASGDKLVTTKASQSISTCCEIVTTKIIDAPHFVIQTHAAALLRFLQAHLGSD